MIKAYEHMREVMTALSPINDATWRQLMECCKVITRSKGECLYPFSEMPSSYCFMHKGIARLYACDDLGQEYNKRFFTDGQFPGVMSALHLDESVDQGIECLTDSELIEIDFKLSRSVLFENTELMAYQIKYLEKHWLLDKDQREILLVQQDATARYLLFLSQFPFLAKAVPQYHLASHLGVSATQLSRIRKTLDFVRK